MAAVSGPRRVPAARVTYRHPVNQALYGQPPLGARIADRVTSVSAWRRLAIVPR